MYSIILWLSIVGSLGAAQWWTFRGRTHPAYVPVEVGLCALSALLWAMLAASTRCNRTLLLWGLAWDLVYTLVLVGVPWWLGVEVRPVTWIWLCVAAGGMIAAQMSMGE